MDNKWRLCNWKDIEETQHYTYVLEDKEGNIIDETEVSFSKESAKERLAEKIKGEL